MPPKSRKTRNAVPTEEPSIDMDDESDSGKSGHNDDGTGKSSSSQVRKAQNRIAQREFRLRKQQYIRDLEARVKVLSADKEDRVELMTLLIRNLLKENKELRDMLKSMASFVGEGLGSCLPRLGLSAPQLDAILSRADTDSAHEAFLALKASTQMQKDNPGIPLGSPRRRGSMKRKRGNTHDGIGKDAAESETPEGPTQPRDMRQESESFGSYSYLFPDLNAFANAPVNTRYPALASVPPPAPILAQYPPPPPPPLPNSQPQWQPQYPSAQSSSYNSPASMQLNLMSLPQDFYAQPFQQTGSGLTIPASASSNITQHTPDNPSVQLQGNQMDEMEDAENQRRLRAAVAKMTAHERRAPFGGELTRSEMEARREFVQEIVEGMHAEGREDSNSRVETIQLITYHLNNFRVNPRYTLPASLKPTNVQQTVPHEYTIDGVIFPSVRDEMILRRGQFDLVEALHGILTDFTVHGAEVLDHHNWEVSERWLRKFSMLVNDEVYTIVNRWRTERGEVPLVRAVRDRNGMDVGAGHWNR